MSQLPGFQLIWNSLKVGLHASATLKNNTNHIHSLGPTSILKVNIKWH